MCFWRFGHSWLPADEALKKKVHDCLKLFGILPSQIEVCVHCKRIRLKVVCLYTGRFYQSIVILPPFPEEA